MEDSVDNEYNPQRDEVNDLNPVVMFPDAPMASATAGEQAVDIDKEDCEKAQSNSKVDEGANEDVDMIEASVAHDGSTYHGQSRDKLSLDNDVDFDMTGYKSTEESCLGDYDGVSSNKPEQLDNNGIRDPDSIADNADTNTGGLMPFEDGGKHGGSNGTNDAETVTAQLAGQIPLIKEHMLTYTAGIFKFIDEDANDSDSDGRSANLESSNHALLSASVAQRGIQFHSSHHENTEGHLIETSLQEEEESSMVNDNEALEEVHRSLPLVGNPQVTVCAKDRVLWPAPISNSGGKSRITQFSANVGKKDGKKWKNPTGKVSGNFRAAPEQSNLSPALFITIPSSPRRKIAATLSPNQSDDEVSEKPQDMVHRKLLDKLQEVLAAIPQQHLASLEHGERFDSLSDAIDRLQGYALKRGFAFHVPDGKTFHSVFVHCVHNHRKKGLSTKCQFAIVLQPRALDDDKVNFVVDLSVYGSQVGRAKKILPVHNHPACQNGLGYKFHMEKYAVKFNRNESRILKGYINNVKTADTIAHSGQVGQAQTLPLVTPLPRATAIQDSFSKSDEAESEFDDEHIKVEQLESVEPNQTVLEKLAALALREIPQQRSDNATATGSTGPSKSVVTRGTSPMPDPVPDPKPSPLMDVDSLRPKKAAVSTALPVMIPMPESMVRPANISSNVIENPSLAPRPTDGFRVMDPPTMPSSPLTLMRPTGNYSGPTAMIPSATAMIPYASSAYRNDAKMIPPTVNPATSSGSFNKPSPLMAPISTMSLLMPPPATPKRRNSEADTPSKRARPAPVAAPKKGVRSIPEAIMQERNKRMRNGAATKRGRNKAPFAAVSVAEGQDGDLFDNGEIFDSNHGKAKKGRRGAVDKDFRPAGAKGRVGIERGSRRRSARVSKSKAVNVNDMGEENTDRGINFTATTAASPTAPNFPPGFINPDADANFDIPSWYLNDEPPERASSPGRRLQMHWSAGLVTDNGAVDYLLGANTQLQVQAPVASTPGKRPAAQSLSAPKKQRRITKKGGKRVGGEEGVQNSRPRLRRAFIAKQGSGLSDVVAQRSRARRNPSKVPTAQVVQKGDQLLDLDTQIENGGGSTYIKREPDLETNLQSIPGTSDMVTDLNTANPAEHFPTSAFGTALPQPTPMFDRSAPSVQPAFNQHVVALAQEPHGLDKNGADTSAVQSQYIKEEEVADDHF